MSVLELTKRELAKELQKHFTPARPISSIEHLIGRDKLLDDAQNALLSAGRHLFVFGDRGVGKTSLAQTAAFLINSARTNPILSACNPTLSFFQLMSDILNEALAQVTPKRATEVEISLNLGPISASLKQALEKGINVEVKSVNAAASVLEYVAALADGEQIVIIDEFDRMDAEQRSLFSDLVKQVSDKGIGIKFIFCGVASSLDDFVGFHRSVGRYVFAIHLDRIDMSSRKLIVSGAYDAMGVTIDDGMLTRISQISDGYPYFVHLIGEQIIYQIHYASQTAKRAGAAPVGPVVTPVHFECGVQSSVAASEGFLKDQYEQAIMAGNNSDFELVLWATAEGPTLTRRVGDIYNESYTYLCDQFELEPVTIEKFRSRMTSLRKSHGELLRSSRAGWYEFSENMMRGYVRMRAIAAGATLSPDHHFGARRRQF